MSSFFCRTTVVADFEFYVLVSEFFKKKVSGEIAFDLISLFHVQIQEPTRSHAFDLISLFHVPIKEPTRSSTTTRAFVFLSKFY